MNNHKCFENQDCKYYPCHKSEHINCKYCFCALFHYRDCGGSYKILGNGWKDCSECLLPHKDIGDEYIIDFLKKRSMQWL